MSQRQFGAGSNLETGTTDRLEIGDLRPLSRRDPGCVAAEGPDLLDIDQEKWKTAQFRLRTILPYLRAEEPNRDLANELSKKAGVHVATLYRWVDRYRSAGHLSGLVPGNPGRNKGDTCLDEELEEIISDAIERIYLTPDRQPPGEVIHEVNKMCRRAGITPPHENTIRNRIKLVPEAVQIRRRGYGDRLKNRHRPVKGETKAGSFPLEFTQIDHSPFDAIIVDEEYRLPLGRPWVTLQVDILTRVITGIVLTLDAPCATTVALCVSRSVLPKNDYLESLGVEGEWPVWGLPRLIQSDNALEFNSAALKRACEQYGIDLQYRPRGRPQYGGHIERLIGVTQKEFQRLPGTTFSNTRDREGYDSEKHAVFTLRELETQLVDWIVNVYHKRKHSTLGMPPLKKWEMELLGEGKGRPAGLPPVPADPQRLYIDFLPYKERTVQRYGIQWDKVNYYKECLNPWINSTDPEKPKLKRKFIVRRDPRDISVVYFYDPDDDVYYTVPYRDPGHPAISHWELREVRKKLEQEGCKDIDENAIFEAVERMRHRTQEAVVKTKKARRTRHRVRRAEKLSAKRTTADEARGFQSSQPQSHAVESKQPESHLEDICAGEIETFDVDLG